MSGHGKRLRGQSGTSQSALHEGRFGRMFRRLRPAPSYPDDVLTQLAESMRETSAPTGWNASAPVQDGDNDTIPAAYTYFGQFVDHDITFDPASSLQKQNDPDALTDFRTPRFDLDSLFGSGPDDEPFQYVHTTDPPRLLIEPNIRGELDLPRTSAGIAIIGDPRNDENIIVSQLQLTFAKAYNKLAEQVAADPSVPDEDKFAVAQRLLRWHYQWIIAFDFLPRICGKDLMDKLLRHDEKTGSWEVKRRFYRPTNNAYMPVEFSAAAYRYGHSQVRPTYDLNGVVTARPIFAPGDSLGELDDLRGFRPVPSAWTVDWSLFLQMASGAVPQPSRQINSKLSAALFDLPGESDPERQSLAFRNLKRGQALGLPSGQDVAKLMSVQVLSGADLGGVVEPTPLWFYILKEAELLAEGKALGPVGARIVAETMLGLLEVDKQSWVNAEPTWQPTVASAAGNFSLADLIAFATS